MFLPQENLVLDHQDSSELVSSAFRTEAHGSRRPTPWLTATLFFPEAGWVGTQGAPSAALGKVLELNLAFAASRPECRLLFSPAFLGEDKGAGGVGGHRGPAQGAHRAGGWAASRLEGTEVMCPQEVLGGFLHGSHIQAAAGSQMSGQERMAGQAGLASPCSLKPLTLPEAPSTGFVQIQAACQAWGSR